MVPHLKRLLISIAVLHAGLLLPSIHAAELKNHPSPYLSLHADDPVKWQVWGKDVLKQARDENKLVYLSIGYFSCHWCHVMQQESYADQEVGAFLNKHFIPVKVDRELRPQLDRRMIAFVEAVRGNAGWPLNVFVTAEGYPVTGFTYLPKDNFMGALQGLDKQWKNNHAEIKKQAKAYFEQTESSETRSTLMTLPDRSYTHLIDAFVSQTMRIADELQGGFGDSNKFPSYPQLNALLKIIRITSDIDEDVINFFRLTLDTMASRHLMDHVNGGFFRYVVDPDWQTPHFEKMLYDNAQLAALYFDAESEWPAQGYAEVGLRTVAFMHKFLANVKGGFNASLSAVDANNIEGGAYYWDQAELRTVLSGNEFEYLKDYVKWNPTQTSSIQIKPLSGLGAGGDNPSINSKILHKLQQVTKAQMPVDDKRLASWNALVLKALIKAEQHSESPELARQQTDLLYQFMRRTFIRDGRVIRFAAQPESAEKTLTDYAQMAHAFQHYAASRKDASAQSLVDKLVRRAFDLYHRDGRWIQDTDSLIPGNRGEWLLQDAVLESPLSLLLESVYLMPRPAAEIKQKTDELILRLTQDVIELPFYYGSSIVLRQLYHEPAASAAQ